MASFAGPVFTEWYWGPIFLVVVLGPPLALAAFVVEFAVNRWIHPLRPPFRGLLRCGVVVAGTLAILAGGALLDQIHFEHRAKAAARDLDFTPYAPANLPSPLRVGFVDVGHGRQPVLVSHYSAGRNGYALAYQQRAAVITLEAGRCSLHGLAGTGTTFYEGPCREQRTPAGRRVYLGASPQLVGGDEAFSLFDGTLVRMSSSGVRERTVLAWFDALRPVQPAHIDFKRP